MEKKNYYVQVPFAGMIGVSVEATDEEHAKELAMDSCSAAMLQWDNNETPDKCFIEETEWDIYDKLVEGNVCYTYHTEIVVEEE